MNGWVQEMVDLCREKTRHRSNGERVNRLLPGPFSEKQNTAKNRFSRGTATKWCRQILKTQLRKQKAVEIVIKP